MIPSGPLGYDLRSCSNVEGRRTVGQYFDFDFYCLFLYLGLIRFSDGACVGRGGIKKSGEKQLLDKVQFNKNNPIQNTSIEERDKH